MRVAVSLLRSRQPTASYMPVSAGADRVHWAGGGIIFETFGV